MLFRNRASSNLYQSQIANLKKGRLTLEGSIIIKGNYYYAKFRVNGKQKMIATKIPVKGSNKRPLRATRISTLNATMYSLPNSSTNG